MELHGQLPSLLQKLALHKPLSNLQPGQKSFQIEFITRFLEMQMGFWNQTWCVRFEYLIARIPRIPWCFDMEVEMAKGKPGGCHRYY